MLLLVRDLPQSRLSGTKCALCYDSCAQLPRLRREVGSSEERWTAYRPALFAFFGFPEGAKAHLAAG
jgi:hypothetical protein